jgi:hypothetical protein
MSGGRGAAHGTDPIRFRRRQISTVNASIATYIRAWQPDQIGHHADTLSWNRNSVHPLKDRGAVSALAHPYVSPGRRTLMAKNSVPNAGRAGYQRAQHLRPARLPLRTAWTVTLVLSLGLWGVIWLVVTAIG